MAVQQRCPTANHVFPFTDALRHDVCGQAGSSDDRHHRQVHISSQLHKDLECGGAQTREELGYLAHSVMRRYFHLITNMR